MIIFSVTCALLIALALAFILPPLRQPDRSAAADTRNQANLAIYRRQLVDMESDRRHRIITNDQFQREREELEQRLIVDVANDRRTSRKNRPPLASGPFMYALGVGLPVAAILLYLTLGTPSSIGQIR